MHQGMYPCTNLLQWSLEESQMAGKEEICECLIEEPLVSYFFVLLSFVFDFQIFLSYIGVLVYVSFQNHQDQHTTVCTSLSWTSPHAMKRQTNEYHKNHRNVH